MNHLAAVSTAFERRAAFHADPQTTVYRLFHGYAEGQPGLTIDRFADTAVITHKVDLGELMQPLATRLCELYPFERVIAKAHRYFNWDSRPLSVTPLVGELPTEPLQVRDNGLTLLATLHTPDSIGLFLDSRPARAWLLENSRDRRILNLFAYTGSLGVAAAAGGARQVVHVDSKQNPLEVAKENHRLNGLAVDDRSFMKGNVYKHLPKAARKGAQFDGVILDPPPRVPDRMARRQPQGQDYPQLAPLAASLLAPGGWLLCFFNRFDRSRELFEQDVLEHAGMPLSVTWRSTSGDDFPESDPERKLRMTVFTRG